jgi:hypothetical protein
VAEKRLDSRLEAEGAEFLVLGMLLTEGIQATKAYTRFPGYDLVAFNPEKSRQCRIQVKMRWATDYNRSFPIKRDVDCDFVVFVALNRGYRYGRRVTALDSGRHAPDVYVFPINALREHVRISGGWSKLMLDDVPSLDSFKDQWDLIRRHLDLPAPVPSSEDQKMEALLSEAERIVNRSS